MDLMRRYIFYDYFVFERFYGQDYFSSKTEYKTIFLRGRVFLLSNDQIFAVHVDETKKSSFLKTLYI